MGGEVERQRSGQIEMGVARPTGLVERLGLGGRRGWQHWPSGFCLELLEDGDVTYGVREY